jgi:hypothetical protein
VQLPPTGGSINDGWDEVLQFHETACKNIPNGKAGLIAIKTIRRILGAKWTPPKPGISFEYSPWMGIHNRFWHAYEPNYRWLIHFARKLEGLTRIPGNERVIDRFHVPEEYPSLIGEMDFGLKVSLSKISCSYDFEKGKPTPDLIATIGNEQVDIEITSLNRPREDVVGMEALDWVPRTVIEAKCVSGGIWGRVPTNVQFERVKKKVLAGIKKAKAKRTLVEVNEPGVLLCNIVLEEIAGKASSPWPLGNFVIRNRSVSKKDRLARTIENKAKAQLSRGHPSVLVVYDRFSSPDEARGFLGEKEIELSVGAFSNLAGVILVSPFNTFYGAENFSGSPQVVTKENRTLVECSLPDNEAEISTIWGHPWQRHRSAVEALVQCLLDFPRNLVQLYSER